MIETIGQIAITVILSSIAALIFLLVLLVVVVLIDGAIRELRERIRGV